MYIVLFPSGKTLTFSIKALAEIYVDAYGAPAMGCVYALVYFLFSLPV